MQSKMHNKHEIELLSEGDNPSGKVEMIDINALYTVS